MKNNNNYYLLGSYHIPSTVIKHFTVSLVLTIFLQGSYYPHYTNEKTEVLRG